jgi:hypothetical protein
MTLDELKRNMARNILRQQILRRDLEPKVLVTDTEARADYDARKAEFSHPGTVQLQEILVRGDDARSQAEDLAAKARAGEDFGDLARAHSVAASKGSGGELGKLARGDMNPELEKVAFALPAGAVSDPIPSGDGYRILKVEAKADASVTPFEEVKDAIRRTLGEKKMNKELEGYIANLRDKAIINVMVREVPQELIGPGASTPSVLREGGETTPSPEPGAQPAASSPKAPAPAADDAEIVTTPQERPEAVAPPAAPQPKKKDAPIPPPSAP